MIEFSHRVTSGLTLVFVAGLLLWAWRAYPKGHPVRLGAVLAVGFTITEALVGAGLVLFQLVAQNDSVARAVSVAVHLANTFLLLASLTLTAAWASGARRLRLAGRARLSWPLGIGLLGVLILGVTGAITALGDTLFPSGSLVEGMAQDFSPTAHFLIRLRVIHPVVATLTGVYVVILARLARLIQRRAAGQAPRHSPDRVGRPAVAGGVDQRHAHGAGLAADGPSAAGRPAVDHVRALLGQPTGRPAGSRR